MRPDPGSIIGITLVLGIVALFIGSLVSAIILRAAAHWAIKLEIEFWSAFGTVFFAGLVNCTIGFVVGALVGPENPSALLLGELGMLFVNFLVLTIFVSVRHTLPSGKAMKVVAYMYGISILIGVLIGAAFAAVFLFTGVLQP
jgi:hypothetical protein